jgi:nicotinate dehydrogenase subunit A
MNAAPVALHVNGRACSVRRDPGSALLYALRNDLGLHGARFGCGMGLCGACVVQGDGRPVFSCDTTLEQAAGRTVRTVEGLDDPAGAALLQAFEDVQAGQCGYCLPGIVVRAHALLQGGTQPSRESIALALERHLCRCGAHGRILDAIELAAARLEAAA